MKVITPENPQGFCFGVKRAIDLVKSASFDKPLQVLGLLVHNPGVVSDLASHGITTVKSIDDITCETVAITAHGAPKGVSAILSDKKLIDATCPFVERFQKQVEELSGAGYQIVILGDVNHPEIISVSSFADSPVVVDSAEEAKDVGWFEKIALVCQTTQNIETLQGVAGELVNHTDHLLVKNTICSSTRTRQEDAVKLSKKVSAMVVVGGFMSANTSRLVKLSKAQGAETFWIEKTTDLDPNLLEKIFETVSISSEKTVGLLSGASTPIESVDEVYKILSEYGE